MNRKLLAGSFFALFFLVFSCDLTDNKNQIPLTMNKHLVNYTLAKTVSQAFVKTSFNTLGTNLPVNISDSVKYDVRVYKVSYKTKFNNKDLVASGLVCLPVSESGREFPIFSFQNGTVLLRSKAPSVSADDNQEIHNLIANLASLGFVVVIPDYLGFGTSIDTFHPYLLKEPTVNTILDMYAAVREMASPQYLNVNLGKRICMMGYSMGAWATMALKHEIETNPQLNKDQENGFELFGTAVGGGPYDLVMMMENIMAGATYAMPAYLGYLFHSYIEAKEIELQYQDVFNSPFAGLIPGLYNGTRDAEYINSRLDFTISSLFTQDFRTDYASGTKFATLRQKLAENSIEPWKTTTPLLLTHGGKDEVVDPEQAVNFVAELLLAGTNVNLLTVAEFENANHTMAVYPFAINSLAWLLNLK